ncbi:MAG TPA: hypothetical protein VFM18_17680 [Methanosarcina sp.]|nr:hypothetical protein [Methanosarcina sp.]
MALKIQDVNTAILTGSFSNDELSSIIDAVKYARAQLGKQVKRALVKGVPVKWTSSRDGIQRSGTVERVKVKFVIVKTPTGSWNVPANMLEVI